MSGRPSSTRLFKQIQTLFPAVKAQLAAKKAAGKSWESLGPWLDKLEQINTALAPLQTHINQRSLKKQRGKLEKELANIFQSIRLALHYKRGKDWRPDYPLRKQGMKHFVYYRRFYNYWCQVEAEIVSFLYRNEGITQDKIEEKVLALENIIQQQTLEQGYVKGFYNLVALKRILIETLVLLGKTRLKAESLIKHIT